MEELLHREKGRGVKSKKIAGQLTSPVEKMWPVILMMRNLIHIGWALGKSTVPGKRAFDYIWNSKTLPRLAGYSTLSTTYRLAYSTTYK